MRTQVRRRRRRNSLLRANESFLRLETGRPKKNLEIRLAVACYEAHRDLFHEALLAFEGLWTKQVLVH